MLKGIIPTGGRGTRMRPLTFSTNKHFIPVANKPLIFYPIETLVGAGVNKIAITYNPGQLEAVQQVLGSGNRWGAEFSYILQEKPIGLANIVQVCEEYLAGDSFVFHLGDNIFVEGIKNLVSYFLTKKPNGLVSMVHHPENKRLGVPFFDASGRLLKYIEKPNHPPHDFAIPGIYFGDENFFKVFKGADAISPSERGEYEIPAAFQWLIDHGFLVDVIEYQGKWLDPGKFDDWLSANKYLLEKKLKAKNESKLGLEVSVEGIVDIGKNCKIKKTKIIGPSVVADNVEILESTIGPLTSIGANCRIENSIVENSVLMEGVKIQNPGKKIANSLIGTDTQIVNGYASGGSMSLFVGEKSKIEL